MIVYHGTRIHAHYENILKTQELLAGKRVRTNEYYVHVSVAPFTQGSYGLQMVSLGHKVKVPKGQYPNTAWVIECEISDDTPLEPDTTDEDVWNYGTGNWRIYRGEKLAINVISVEHVINVDAWESVPRKTIDRSICSHP